MVVAGDVVDLDGLWAIGIVFMVIVMPIWLFLHYGWRWKQARLLTSESESTLAELVVLADRLESRIVTLERLLDTASPDWRRQS